MNSIDSFAFKRRLVESMVANQAVTVDFSRNSFAIHFDKISAAPRFQKILRNYFGVESLIMHTDRIEADQISDRTDQEALDYFTTLAYSKRYGRFKGVLKPKLKNAYTIGVYIKTGRQRVLLASLSGQTGADSEIFKIYDLNGVIASDEKSQIGYINTLVFNPVFDYKNLLSPIDKCMVNLFLKIVINKLYSELHTRFSFDGIKKVYLITIPKVLDFLLTSGIVFDQVPSVPFLQNEYTDYIFNNFQKYWQPVSADDTPQVFLFTGVDKKIVQRNRDFRLEYDTGSLQMKIDCAKTVSANRG